ncbi:lytic transglycosylase [Salinarimonas ramus]|uniref:Lytic transglycosylase n=2 Tax=Salinarimonas ramus TaxID=690164 RepID=A0A917Q6I0_9HYPH|nr:lytic transglycosylase [Salinarimonas ramus]
MMRRALLILVAAATLTAGSISDVSPARAEENICEAEMIRAAAAHDVPLAVLFAVGLTETGRRGTLHPYALNIAGRSFFGTSRAEALAEFERERAAGVKLIDLGCMQINHYWHGQEFDTVADMLDPEKNVTYAALFLKQLRARHGSWTLAVARYHAGPRNTPAQKRYVCAVIRHMVSSGMGAWTPNARSFCG